MTACLVALCQNLLLYGAQAIRAKAVAVTFGEHGASGVVELDGAALAVGHVGGFALKGAAAAGAGFGIVFLHGEDRKRI